MTLQELIEEMGWTPRSYSGRGMSGKSCLGVTITGSPVEFAFHLGVTCCDNAVDFNSSIRYDSMGLDTIVYFPKVQYMSPEEEEEEEEEE